MRPLQGVDKGEHVQKSIVERRWRDANDVGLAPVADDSGFCKTLVQGAAVAFNLQGQLGAALRWRLGRNDADPRQSVVLQQGFEIAG